MASDICILCSPLGVYISLRTYTEDIRKYKQDFCFSKILSGKIENKHKEFLNE